MSIDLTPPVKGVVKDGKDPNEDMRYSSKASTVASTWKQFSDPESGLKNYLVNIYRKPAGKYVMFHVWAPISSTHKKYEHSAVSFISCKYFA